MKKSILCLIFICLLGQLFAGDLNGTWYMGSNSGTPSISDPASNSFTWGTDGTSETASTGSLWSYFPDMTLVNDGDAITLSFTVTPLDASATTQSLRFGLFNDGGTQVLNNISGTNSDAGFLSTMGYFVKWQHNTTGSLVARTGGKTNPCSDSSLVNNLTETASGPAVTLTQGTAYDMTFTVTRNSAAEYLVSASVDDGTSVTLTEATTTNINATSFNTFFMLHPPTGIDSFEFANIRVDGDPRAMNPLPANDASNTVVLTNASLNWDVGQDVTGSPLTNVASYNVYLGAANDPNLTTVTPVTVTETGAGGGSYTPASELERDAVYTWRVDEVLTDTSVIKGSEWKFATVLSFPMVTGPEADTLVDAGTAVDLIVAAVNPFTSDDTGMEYQWYQNGTPVATTATLSIPSAQIANEGEYYCVVTITSNGATTQSDSGWLNVKRVVQYHAFENDLVDTNGTNDGSAFLLETYAGEDPNSFPATAAFDTGFDGAGQALSLDGDHYIDIGVAGSPKAHASLEHGAVACWLQTSATGDESVLGSFNDDSATAISVRVVDGQVREYLRDEDGTYIGRQSGTVNDGQWHYIVTTCTAGPTGAEVSVYVDGESFGTSTSSGDFSFADWQYQMLIGAQNSRGIPAKLFVGLIDEVKVYNHALTADDVAIAYEGYTGIDTCVYPPALDFTGPGPVDSNEDGVFDKDCVVDIYDFAYFASSWLECGLIPACL